MLCLLNKQIEQFFDHRRKIVHESRVALRDDLLNHMQMFTNAFMKQYRKKEWRKQFLEKLDYVCYHSHYIPSHLNGEYCTKLERDVLEYVDKNCKGIFWDFIDDPLFVTMEEATVLSQLYYPGLLGDAVFSIDPGRLAVVFSERNGTWLCKRDRRPRAVSVRK